jgi:hypothetical protein
MQLNVRYCTVKSEQEKSYGILALYLRQIAIETPLILMNQKDPTNRADLALTLGSSILIPVDTLISCSGADVVQLPAQSIVPQIGLNGTAGITINVPF